MHGCMLSHFSHVQLFATLWTVACQASLSMGFSRQEYWSGLSCPPLQGMTQGSSPCILCLLHYQADSLPVVAWESPYICIYVCIYNVYWMALCIYNLEYLKICLTVVTQVYAVSSIFLKHSLANLLCEN